MRRRQLALGGAAAAALVAATVAARRNPSACPYSQRWVLELPHPGVTRARLVDLLEPRPGERIVEIGPGTGHYALEVAPRLEPGGTLDVFDIQQEMLDHTLRRARELGSGNVVPTQGDARSLPYPEASLDAAYLVTVLGEIPDQDAALRELQRVLKPGGRLVVGELALDPHFVTRGALRRRAEQAGLRFDRLTGVPLAYLARFRA
jgi:ubiquinone/menaquinone biosynthesis C-methylase UbiE